MPAPVALHYHQFFIGQGERFLQDGIRDAHFPDIMQQSPPRICPSSVSGTPILRARVTVKSAARWVCSSVTWSRISRTRHHASSMSSYPRVRSWMACWDF